MPASRRVFPPNSATGSVIIFATDPEAQVQLLPELLGRMYGLTCAESRLAEQLIRGERLVDAAERLVISHNTARTHLQRIYDKTGTRHQGELIRLLLPIANLMPDEQVKRSRGVGRFPAP